MHTNDTRQKHQGLVSFGSEFWVGDSKRRRQNLGSVNGDGTSVFRREARVLVRRTLYENSKGLVPARGRTQKRLIV